MSKILTIVATACFAAVMLGACSQNEAPPPAQVEQKAEVLPAPTNPADKDGWKKYLVSAVTANMDGVKTNHPYMYFVPAGDDETTVNDRANQLDNVTTVVARGVLPGNMMAFGGPDSATTAQLMIDAFKDVQAGAFKDVRILFIGNPADFDGVKQALASSGADLRFVEVK